MSPANILGTAFAALLNSLWQSAALALLAWAALRLLPRINVAINAATRCAVWWAVLAAVVVLPLIPQTQIRRTQMQAPAPVSFAAPSVPAAVAIEPAISAPAQSRPAAPPSRGPLEITAGAGLLAIFAIWSALSLFRLAQIARSYRYLRGIKQRSRAVTEQQLVNFDSWLLACGIDRTARLLVSSEIASPMAVGFRRPAVVVPETLLKEFSTEELDHVILHELAHIARYDDWTNLFARAIGALLPVHPVAVWLVKRIEQDREIACDDWVVAMTGEARPYAASLTRLFEVCSARRRQLLATGMADRASHLGERIEALLRAGRDFAPRVSLFRVALGVAILGGLVLVSAQTPHWIAFAQEPLAAPNPPVPPEAAVPPEPPEPPSPQTAPVAPAPAIPPELPARPDVPQTTAAQQTLEFLRQEYAERGRTLTPSHPDMIRLAQAIRQAEQASRAQESELRAYQAQARLQGAQARAQFQQQQQQQQAQVPQNLLQERPGSLLAALVAAGYGGLPVDDIIDLRNHGVSPEFLRALGPAGQTKLSTKDLITLADNGVHPDLVRALREAFPQITAREMVEAAQNGLRPNDLREAKQFSQSLTLEQIIRLKKAGVI